MSSKQGTGVLNDFLGGWVWVHGLRSKPAEFVHTCGYEVPLGDFPECHMSLKFRNYQGSGLQEMFKTVYCLMEERLELVFTFKKISTLKFIFFKNIFY